MPLKNRPVGMRDFKSDIAQGKWRINLRRKSGETKQFIATIDNDFIPEADRWTKRDFLKGLAPTQLRLYVIENNVSALDGSKWRDIRYTNIISYERIDGE